MERGRRRYLCLGTSSGTLFFPLSFLDDATVWNEVVLRVPPAALEPAAIERLPDYQDWARERRATASVVNARPEEIGMEPGLSAVADHWTLQIVGWAGLGYCLFAGVSAWSSGRMVELLGFFLLAGACLYGMARWGITLITADQVRRQTFLESRVIAWSDVRWVEIDPLGLALVMGGEKSQLAIPGPVFWSAMGRQRAMKLFYTQLRERGIPLRRTALAVFRFSRQRARRDGS